uniref:Uncharacterized protein n=1 Tax=Glossina palpalis gambiensis TaxID=67801 RepID=A0A1B0BXG3_9MUSC
MDVVNTSPTVLLTESEKQNLLKLLIILKTISRMTASSKDLQVGETNAIYYNENISDILSDSCIHSHLCQISYGLFGFVATFCMLFGRLLPILHDIDFCDEKLLIVKPLQPTLHVRLMPFTLAEIVQLLKTLKEVSLGLVELALQEMRSTLN